MPDRPAGPVAKIPIFPPNKNVQNTTDRTGALRGKTPASRRQVSLRCNKNWAWNSFSHLGRSGSRREIPIFRDVALAPRFRPPPGSRVRPRIGHASARTTVADDFPDFIFSEARTDLHLYSYAVLILRPGSRKFLQRWRDRLPLISIVLCEEISCRSETPRTADAKTRIFPN